MINFLIFTLDPEFQDFSLCEDKEGGALCVGGVQPFKLK